MPLIYRSMTRDGDKPKIGSSARALGARVRGDERDDISVDSLGHVRPGTGGMSCCAKLA